MHTRLFTLFIGLFVLTAGQVFAQSTQPASADKKFGIDLTHSAVIFSVKHLGVSNYYNRFSKFTGSISEDADGKLASVEVNVDATSVDIDHKGFKKHVLNADFLDAKKFATITFKSTKIEATDKANFFKVSGELSFMGKKEAITVTVEKIGSGKDPWGGHRVGYEAKFSLDRTKFMKGYKGVGDKVNFIIALEGLMHPKEKS